MLWASYNVYLHVTTTSIQINRVLHVAGELIASEANSAYDAYAYDEIEWNNFIIIYKATPWIMKLHYFIISVHHSFCVSC